MPVTAAATTGFLHMVYFYPGENAGPGEAARLIAGCHKYLTAIPGVLRLEVGIPAGTPRAVVDNTYAVALQVEFADSAAHDLYQDHSLHHQFIAECSPAWSRVQIFDTLIERP